VPLPGTAPGAGEPRASSRAESESGKNAAAADSSGEVGSRGPNIAAVTTARHDEATAIPTTLVPTTEERERPAIPRARRNNIDGTAARRSESVAKPTMVNS